MIQRFGGALNLNVHVHALVIDGVFAKDGDALRFHPGLRLTRDEVVDVVAVIVRRIARLLASEPEDQRIWTALHKLLDTLSATAARSCPAADGPAHQTGALEAAAIGRILQHLGLPTAIPRPRPARAPPLPAGVPDAAGWNDDTAGFAP